MLESLAGYVEKKQNSQVLKGMHSTFSWKAIYAIYEILQIVYFVIQIVNFLLHIIDCIFYDTACSFSITSCRTVNKWESHEIPLA